MNVGVSIDTNALSALIKSDPDFEIKVKQSVLENLARRHVRGVEEDIKQAVTKASAEATAQIAKNYGSYTDFLQRTFKLNDTFVALVTNDAAKKANEAVYKVLNEAVDIAIAERMEKLGDTINVRVSDAIRNFTQKAVTAAVEKRVNEVMAALSKGTPTT